MGLRDGGMRRGTPDGDSSSLDQLLTDVAGPIEQRALVQVSTRERPRNGLWGLLLLTADELHVIYGEGESWVQRLIHSSPPQHKHLTMTYVSLEAIELPPRGGFLHRLLSGPTVRARIRRRHEPDILLDVDERGRTLLEDAQHRLSPED